jgi:hypothetical protein
LHRGGIGSEEGDLSRWVDAIVSLEDGNVFFEPPWAVRAAELAGVLCLCDPTDGSCEVDLEEGHDFPVWHLAEGRTDSDYDLVTGFKSWRSSSLETVVLLAAPNVPADTGDRPRGSGAEPLNRWVRIGDSAIALRMGAWVPFVLASVLAAWLAPATRKFLAMIAVSDGG